MFSVKFDTDNAQFDTDDIVGEIEQVLATLDLPFEVINEGESALGFVYDINGNKIGEWHYQHERASQ